MIRKMIIIIILLHLTVYVICDDYSQGTADAGNILKKQNIQIRTSMLSGLVSYFIPGCGCAAVSAYNYFTEPELPAGIESETAQYRDGFKKVYIPEIKNRQLKYSLIGGSIGSVLSIASIAVILIIVKNL